MPRVLASPYLVAALMLCACGPAACGSSGPTKRDVIARGDAICETAFRDAHTIPPPAAGSLSSLAEYLRRVTPIVENEVAGLRALPQPAQSRALLERYVAAMTASATQYRALAAAAARGDPAGVTGALAALRSTPASSLAAGYGFKSCAESATSATGTS